MLPLSVALVAKSLDGNVGTQTQEQENKDRRTYVKKCDKRDRNSNCSGDPHIPGIDLSMVPALVRHLYEDQSPLLDQ